MVFYIVIIVFAVIITTFFYYRRKYVKISGSKYNINTLELKISSVKLSSKDLRNICKLKKLEYLHIFFYT